MTERALTHDEMWAVYDLTITKALSIEAAEEATQTGCGSPLYRGIARKIRAQIEASDD